MNLDYLFKRTVDDLADRIASHDPYDALLASGLVRKLFLDEVPLVAQVNREHGVKYRFTVADWGGTPREPGLVVWSLQDGLSPKRAIHSRGERRLCKDDFFAVEVAFRGEHTFTVKDVVRVASNKLGGVHRDARGDERELALMELDRDFLMFGRNWVVRQMLAIGDVCVHALAELRAAAS